MNASALFVGFTLLLGTSALAHSNENVQRGNNQQQNQERPKPPKMDEATKAKVDACAKEAGMPAKDSGTRPSRDVHEKFRACLEKQGIEMPPPPPHEGREHGSGKKDGSSSSSQPPSEPKR
jgi:hypothetical protein